MNEELKQSKQILMLIPGNIYWKDQKGCYLGCNDRQLRIARVTSLKEMIGKTDRDLYPAFIANRIMETDAAIMKEGKEVICEETGIDAHGNEAIYLSQKTPLIDEKNGKVIGLVGTSVNITQQKKIWKNLAEAANKAKTEFLANMRHEFRTPIGGIVSIAHAIKENNQNPDMQMYTDMLIDATQILLNLNDQILEFVRLSTHETPYISQPFALKTLIEEIITLYQPTASQKQLKLELYYDDALPAQVIGNALRFKKLLLELIANALKFTHQGQITVSVELVQQINHNIIIKLRVKDTGIGIPKDQTQAIFSTFTRLSASHQGVSGLGLGLANINQLIRDLDGNIEVESQVGVGSTFICTIPFKQVDLP